jgi:hypothetical protein
MEFKSIYTDMQFDLQLINAAADDETLYGAGVDMAGYDGVFFGAAVLKGEAATFTLKAQQDTASNFGSAADLVGTGKSIVIATGTDGAGFIEIKSPKERYVRPALVCPNVGSAKSVAIFSLRYGAKYLPETNSDGELHVNPAEGTA